MSMKKPLNEGLVEKALGAIWTALIKNKREAVLRKFENDPRTQKLITDLDKLRKEMEERLDKKRKTDPHFKASEDEWLSIMNKTK